MANFIGHPRSDIYSTCIVKGCMQAKSCLCFIGQQYRQTMEWGSDYHAGLMSSGTRSFFCLDFLLFTLVRNQLMTGMHATFDPLYQLLFIMSCYELSYCSPCSVSTSISVPPISAALCIYWKVRKFLVSSRLFAAMSSSFSPRFPQSFQDIVTICQSIASSQQPTTNNQQPIASSQKPTGSCLLPVSSPQVLKQSASKAEKLLMTASTSSLIDVVQGSAKDHLAGITLATLVTVGTVLMLRK